MTPDPVEADYGVTIKVEPNAIRGVVLNLVRADSESPAFLTPEQAREVARQLLEVADA